MKRTLGILAFAAIAATLAAAGQERTPPALTFDPAAADFGDQVAGAVSKPVRITVTNTGGSDLYLNSVALSGDNRADFGIAGDTCTGTTLKPGKSCVVDVVMTPQTTGSRRAELVFRAAGGTTIVTLSGNGINSAAVPPR